MLCDGKITSEGAIEPEARSRRRRPLCAWEAKSPGAFGEKAGNAAWAALDGAALLASNHKGEILLEDYRATLHLPKTAFPMKGNLPQREPEMLARWEELDLYNLVLRHSAGRPSFSLHDGPPYANGQIHLGTAFQKIVKDITVKSRTMLGFQAPYVPGWDTHGLPIEMKALETVKTDRHEIDPVALRDLCAAYASRHIGIMEGQFKRLGVRGDWANPYITMEKGYEAQELRIFGQMLEQGLLYKGLKPVHWCPQCESALAEAEIEYHEHTSPSIYVRFAVTDGHGIVEPGTEFLAWTTTPWTLPANRGLSVHPELTYVELQSGWGRLIVAESTLQRLAELPGFAPHQVLWRRPGRDFEGVLVQHPIFGDQSYPVMVGEHVLAEEGTGVVHTAPAHGEEDFEIGSRYGLAFTVPVDARGYFTQEAGPYAGVRYDRSNAQIVADLEASGRIAHATQLQHQYPHCWRCRRPTIFRATEQWFLAVTELRERLEDAISEVLWMPGWGRERMSQMTANRGDWCISRQRVWGLPIPVFYCDDCGAQVATRERVERVADAVAHSGSNIWWQADAKQLLGDLAFCPQCQGGHLRQETDTLDVWFDSGASHLGVQASHPELPWPFDLYVEGHDQFRGWFNSSLTEGVVARGRAPYRAVLCHGFILDGEGKKMSKSLGNVITPEQVLARQGADVFRLWVASTDFRADIHASLPIIDQVAESYRKVRNTFRFMLGNVGDLTPQDGSDPAWEWPERFILARLKEVIGRVREAYLHYQYQTVFRTLLQFMTSDLSALYLDVRKDLLYCGEQRARRQAQQALMILTEAMMTLWAPILTFTTEEVHDHLPLSAAKPPSVQLLLMPDGHDLPAQDPGDEIMVQWRERALVALERARADGVIGTSLEGRLILQVDPSSEEGRVLQEHRADLCSWFIVSQVSLESALEPGVRVQLAEGVKCARCWNYFVPEGGRDAELCPRCTGVLANRPERLAD